MKLPLLLVALVFVSSELGAEKMPDTEEPKGIIGRAYIDGLPVIYKFVDKAPTDAKRKTLPWLTVNSWKYDGSENNGSETEQTVLTGHPDSHVRFGRRGEALYPRSYPILDRTAARTFTQGR